MATPRRVTRASSREAVALLVPANLPVPNTPGTGRRARQAGARALERPPVPTKASNAYGAAGTPNMPLQLGEVGPANAIQAIAAGVDTAVKTTTGPQAGPQAGPEAGPSNSGLPGIAEEGEDDGDGDGDEGAPPAGGNNAPTKNAPTKNAPTKTVPGNDTTGNNTGNTNTFDDPSNVLDDVTLRLKQQAEGGRNARRPVNPVLPVLPVRPVRPVRPLLRREVPPRFSFNSCLNVSIALLLLVFAWWFWTWGAVFKAQHGLGTPYEFGQRLGQRLGFGQPGEVGTRFQSGNTPGKTATAPEVSLLLQRINSLERRLDATPLAEAAARTRQINFFAIGAGAIIEPLITSPTKTTRRPFFQKVRAWFWGIYVPEGFGPMEALSTWDDIGDCWCAPPTGHPWAGRAQIGVLLPRKIFPTELVIEHIPASATFDIHSAPKELELWALIEDDAAREAVGNAIFPLLPDDSTAVNPSNFNRKFDDPMQSLDHRYVRIGKWKYDIHAPDHIQTFRVPIELQHFDAVVKKVVVRSLNNWGVTSYTCFYRLKLHGNLAFPELREEDKHVPEKHWFDQATDWVTTLFWDWL